MIEEETNRDQPWVIPIANQQRARYFIERAFSTDLGDGNMEALIFDMDDTLVVEETAATDAFLETCRLAEERFAINAEELQATVRETCRRLWHESPARAYCLEIGISSWEGLWARFEGDDPNLRTLREWGPVYRLDSWYKALKKYGVDNIAFAAQLSDAFGKNRRKSHLLYDDVHPFLEEFSKLYRLGLLSNGAPDLQREKLGGTGIEGYFTEIVISGEVGYGKPDHRIYELILSRLGVRPECAMMIGNSLKSDIKGAQAVGMKTAWLNRNGISHNESIIPDLEAPNLRELKKAFQQGILGNLGEPRH
jgi:putative hydrolase of the HAD superfamily